MGQMHRSNALRCRGLFQKCIDSFLMQTGLEEILQFRKCKVNIGSELDLQACPLFDRFLAEPAQPLQIHQVNVIKSDKPVGILHHKCFRNNKRVDFISLCLAYFNEQRGQLVDETDEQGGDWIKECCEKLIFVNAIEQIKRVLVIKKEGKTEIRKKLNFLEISEATLFADNIDIICKNIVDQCMQIRI